MRKLNCLLIAFAIFAVACENSFDEQSKNQITLSSKTIEVHFESNEHTINVTSPYSWIAESKNDWISLTCDNGIAGTEELRFVCDRNLEESERKGTIVIKNEDFGLATELYVTQKSFIPELVVYQEGVLSFTEKGGTDVIKVSSNFNYDVSDDASWISCYKVEEGVKVSVSASGVLNERTAKITIYSEKYNLSNVVGIIQEPYSESFIEVEDIAEIKFDFCGGEKKISIISNIDYTIQGQTDWLSIERLTNAIKLTALPNYTATTRSATLAISAGESNFYNKEIIITQSVVPSTNCIEYTNDFDGIIAPYNIDAFGGANVMSNTYENGKGIIKFDSPIIIIDSQAFYNSQLTSITLPIGVLKISDSAFCGCDKMTSITIPSSISTIEQSAFKNCRNLKMVYISDLSAWCKIDFSAANANPLSCGAKLYVNHNELTEFITPSDITKIKPYAFCSCYSLNMVILPDHTTEIGAASFSNCKNVVSVSISDSITFIGDSAFASCSSLANVSIPDSVISLGEYAFFNCSGLKNIIIGKGITSINRYSFQLCSSLERINIPDNITSIGRGAFSRCNNLTDIIIGNGITSLNEEKVFEKCISLTNLTIGKNVTSIGEQFFFNCENLMNIFCKASTSPAIHFYYFSNATTSVKHGSFPFNSGMKIYVPRNSYNAYMQYSSYTNGIYQTNWYKYEQYIEPYDFE